MTIAHSAASTAYRNNVFSLAWAVFLRQLPAHSAPRGGRGVRGWGEFMKATSGSSRALRLLAIAALFSLGCETSDSAAGTTPVGTSGYLSCEVGTGTCDGKASCKTDGGKTECVALPDACEGAVTCACLGETACGAAPCTDVSGGGLTCGADSTNTCTPGESFPSPDGCNTCECPPSAKKTDAACTTMGCDPDVCVPGEIFETPDGCNTCTCGADGKRSAAACTEMACTDPRAATRE